MSSAAHPVDDPGKAAPLESQAWRMQYPSAAPSGRCQSEAVPLHPLLSRILFHIYQICLLFLRSAGSPAASVLFFHFRQI